MIRFRCAQCSRDLSVDESKAGKMGRCPGCKTVFTIPAANPVQQVPSAGVPQPQEFITEAPAPVRHRPQGRPPLPHPPEALGEGPPPRRRKRPPALEEEEDVSEREREWQDEEEIERKPRRDKRRKKKRRKKSGSGLGGFGNPLILLLGLGGLLLVLFALAFAVPALIYVPMVLGYLVSLVGGIWFLIIVFQDSPGQGVLCLVVPCYSLFYLVSHWAETKNPFYLQLIGSGIIAFSFAIGGATGVLK